MNCRFSSSVHRCENHALGLLKPELTISQVRAIEILLRKCLPDLAAVEIGPEQTHRYVVEMPATLSRDEWEKKYSSSSSEPISLPTLSEIKKIQ
jgi:hypothetical protein